MTALTVPFSEIPAISTRWLWPGVIPYRTPALIVAPGGTGKGMAVAAMCAIVTTGGTFPGEGEDTIRKPAKVILIAPEDDANEDLAFRLAAAGADLDLVKNLTILPDGSKFTFPQDEMLLRQAIAEESAEGPPVAMVALDPLQGVVDKPSRIIGGARQTYDTLAEIAQDHRIAMPVTHHTTKDGKTVAGGAQLTNAARLVWMVRRNGDVRVMEVWKTNRMVSEVVRWRIEGEEPDGHAVFLDPAEKGATGMSREARLRMGEGVPSLSAAARLTRTACPGCGAEPFAACFVSDSRVCELRTPDRAQRVQSLTDRIMEIQCPACMSLRTAPCPVPAPGWPTGQMCELENGVKVHTRRIMAAISNKLVTRDEIITAFGADIPEGI